MAEDAANFDNPSPNLVLVQSEDSPRTARTLGQSSDRVRVPNSDCPRTVLAVSDSPNVLVNLLKKVSVAGFEPMTY